MPRRLRTWSRPDVPESSGDRDGFSNTVCTLGDCLMWPLLLAIVIGSAGVWL
jgi:hypothetical protein